jgi:hypothetical protein
MAAAVCCATAPREALLRGAADSQRRAPLVRPPGPGQRLLCPATGTRRGRLGSSSTRESDHFGRSHESLRITRAQWRSYRACSAHSGRQP